VILVRHGETQWNIEGRIQGHLDSPLTPSGMRQADAVGKALADVPIAALYASDLGRALHTAEAIGTYIGQAPVPDIRLRERHLGIFQGHTESEIVAQHPAEWAQFRTRDPAYRIPGGETSLDRVHRAMSFLEEIRLRHAGEVVAAVTHGGILDGIFRTVAGVPLDAPRHFKLWNAAVNVISHGANPAFAGWIVELWGYTGSVVPEEVQDDT
jgi:2,3-bisphosphoglycerate-dependent phosphoglycerate mutase